MKKAGLIMSPAHLKTCSLCGYSKLPFWLLILLWKIVGVENCFGKIGVRFKIDRVSFAWSFNSFWIPPTFPSLGEFFYLGLSTLFIDLDLANIITVGIQKILTSLRLDTDQVVLSGIIVLDNINVAPDLWPSDTHHRA